MVSKVVLKVCLLNAIQRVGHNLCVHRVSCMHFCVRRPGSRLRKYTVSPGPASPARKELASPFFIGYFGAVMNEPCGPNGKVDHQDI